MGTVFLFFLLSVAKDANKMSEVTGILHNAVYYFMLPVKSFSETLVILCNYHFMVL